MSSHRIIRAWIILGALVALGLSSPETAHAQSANVMQQDMDVTIDAVGNAEATLKFVLPAMQWQVWKQNYGQNPSLLKRDMQHRFSAMVLRDFAVENDDMNRTATLKLKADADAEYRGNGEWEVELEKGARSARLTDTLWQFTKTSTEGGIVTQQTFRLKLPDGARGSVEATNDFGTPVLRYQIGGGRRMPMLLIAAVVVAVAGLIVLVAGLTRKKT
jgi:hypothetical protein